MTPLPHFDQYNMSSEGNALPATPKGWKIVPAGETIPQEHMECREDYRTGRVVWCSERRCHSTMTPLWALVWGGVRAFAARIQ
jgi:hypothetical protein